MVRTPRLSLRIRPRGLRHSLRLGPWVLRSGRRLRRWALLCPRGERLCAALRLMSLMEEEADMGLPAHLAGAAAEAEAPAGRRPRESLVDGSAL